MIKKRNLNKIKLRTLSNLNKSTTYFILYFISYIFSLIQKQEEYNAGWSRRRDTMHVTFHILFSISVAKLS